jgi:hypothetical protein
LVHCQERRNKHIHLSGRFSNRSPFVPSSSFIASGWELLNRFDEFRAYIRLEMRTGKFWHVMFWFIVESALVNAWILYKVTRELAFLEVEYTHFEFRVAIALALAQEWEDMGCVFIPQQGPAVSSPNTLLKGSRSQSSSIFCFTKAK